MRPLILTERLILRDIVEEDAALLVELDSDPEVMRFIGTTLLDLASYRERIRTTFVLWQAHPWKGIRIVLDRTTGAFLGWVFIRDAAASKVAGELGWTRPDEVEVGFRYRRAAWGRGIATEAARPLLEAALADPDIAAVVGCASAGNIGSLNVLAKLGLDRVGEVVLSGESDATVLLGRSARRDAAGC
jgi:RimJ/RimL family protein N-acetyltransferase